MRKGTIVSEGTEAKIVSRDDAETLVKFASEINITRKAIAKTQGASFDAVCAASVLSWQLSNLHGVPFKKIKTAIIATNVSEKTGERYMRLAKRIALRWTVKGVPLGIRSANAFDAAVDACGVWLKEQGLASIEGVEKWMGASTSAAVSTKSLGELVADKLTKASAKGEMTANDTLAIGRALVTVSDRATIEALHKNLADTLRAFATADLAKADMEAAKEPLAQAA